MQTLKRNFPFLSRTMVGQVLVLAGVLALAGAVLLEIFGRSLPGAADLGATGPLPFVGALVCLKLGLFTFWPEINRRRREAGQRLAHVFDAERAEDPVATLREERELVALNRRAKRPAALALWDQNDPRLDVALFGATVPTFVLSAEQRFLDWNPAFELVFGALADVRRGAHVSLWFKHLDNFRRVPKRTDKLYGEGILPITDRERVAFKSARYGRMVFTKIMSPIVDRGSGRIIGWTVVLNINSVNKRQEFFERLFAEVALETKRVRYAASYDGLFDGFAARAALLDAHRQDLTGAYRVLDLGSGTGTLAAALLAAGHKVTLVEGDVHLLRRAKDKCAVFDVHARLVRQDLDRLKGLPAGRFDAAVLCTSLHRCADPPLALAQVFASLKPGAALSLSVRTAGPDSLYDRVRTHLETSGRYDHLKHQLHHVVEFEREQARAKPYRFLTRDEARILVLAAGFTIERETTGLEDGHTLLLKARR